MIDKIKKIKKLRNLSLKNNQGYLFMPYSVREMTPTIIEGDFAPSKAIKSRYSFKIPLHSTYGSFTIPFNFGNTRIDKIKKIIENIKS